MKTHRLAGKLMVVGGLAMFAAAVHPVPAALLAPMMLGIILLAAGVPLLYSLLLWRRERAAQPSE